MARTFGPDLPPELQEKDEKSVVDKLPRKQCASMAGHRGSILSIRLNCNGQYAMTCGKDRLIKLWNPFKGLCIKTYDAHGREVRDCAITKDNAKFASVGADKQVFFWDVSTGRTIKRFQGHDFPTNSCKFAADDQLIVTGSDDRCIKVWDVRSKTHQAVQTMQPFKDTVMSVDVSPSRPEIAGGSVDGTVRTFDVRMGQMVTDELHAPIVCVRFSSDGALLLTACSDSAARCVDRRTGEVLGTYRGHASEGTKTDCGWMAVDSRLLSGAEDGKVTFWEVMSPVPLCQMRAHDLAVTAVAVREDGKGMVTAGAEGTAKSWTVDGDVPT